MPVKGLIEAMVSIWTPNLDHATRLDFPATFHGRSTESLDLSLNVETTRAIPNRPIARHAAELQVYGVRADQSVCSRRRQRSL